jgi:hypothetical protein
LPGRLATALLLLAISIGAAAEDSWYPRTASNEKGSIVIYAPQIDAWHDFETVEAWVAFEITLVENPAAYVGSVRLEAQTDTDIAEREVLLHDFEIQELTIKGLDEESDEYKLAHEGISALNRTIPLDLILEYLPQDMPIADGGELNPEPPQIFVSSAPALLLSVDAEPMFLPVGETGVQFLLNTNWDVLRVGDDGALFMCYDKTWLTSGDIAGRWAWADDLPAEFGAVPDDANWSNVRACLPDDLGTIQSPTAEPPHVFYATEQAELLLTEGPPDFVPIGETGLSYASNTAQELYQVGADYYFLISGRWFKAADLDGPWVMAKNLPEAFQQIPPQNADESHPKSYIRASIPGTREAWEAALVASIPRKAEIVRGTEEALDIDISYAGEPVFAPIETTDIELAINTSYQVLRFEDTYYLCHNAVWMIASEPAGPWTYADSIPDAFASIPPSSPAYNATFVNIGESDDETIEYEYTAGYDGMYVEEDTVVYGTGYPSSTMTVVLMYGLYDGWFGYPYYPWPPSYGYGSWYDPSTGRYGEAVVGYGPYGAAAGAAVYNPDTGVYGRGQAVWDNDEFAGRGFAYNPNTDTSVARNRYIDFDDNEGWSQGVAQRGDEWRYRETEWEDGQMYTQSESSRGTEGEVYREREGDSIVSEGTITGENRSATFESTIEDGQANASFEGSEGGTGQAERTLDDGQISGSGGFTKDGTTIDSDVTRTAEGVKREFESSEGGQGVSFRSGEDSGFVAESGSGDMYAGRDGNVYQKTEDGWQSVENPGSPSAESRSTGSASTRASSGTFDAGGGAATQMGGTTTGGSLSATQPSASRSNLDRDYQSRQAGFDRYSSHQSSAARAAPRGGRRRR